MVMPNFLIIGAAKSGTTALYEYLKEHPQIYMSPVKEPKFFGLDGEKLNFQGPGGEKANRTVITDIHAYKALFVGVSNETAIGEASPWYLYLEKAPRQIKDYIPKAKLVVILRNPVDRAYSNFLHQIRSGGESINDFSQALQEEEKRIQNNWKPFWHYKQLGFYYAQLNRYFKIFNRDQIKVYLYKDFCSNPIGILQDVFQFLDVDNTFIPDVSKKYNVTSTPKNKNRLLDVFLNQQKLKKSTLKLFLPFNLFQNPIKSTPKKNLAKPQLSSEIRRQLIEEYRDDILKLQELIEQDLSHWLAD